MPHLESHARGHSRRAFTLSELLIAASLSLVVMGAVAALFAILGRSIRNSQATVDLGSRMRAAAWLLRQDLVGITCPIVPLLAPDQNSGYFELLEGPVRDTTFAVTADGRPTTNLSADTDDALLFTTQALSGQFVGRYAGSMIESPFAEVAWFCRPSASQPVADTTLYDLHRRQLLVISYLGRSDLANNALPMSTNRAATDLSLRRAWIDGQGEVLLPNSLGDLTKREHRFMRDGYSFITSSSLTSNVPAQTFPFAFPVVSTTLSAGTTINLARPEAGLDDTPRAWEDVILTNVIAFDVRVFDPQASPQQTGGTWLLPGDHRYTAISSGSSSESGGYVDLGCAGGTPVLPGNALPPAGVTALQSAGMLVANSPRRTVLPAATYDTWSRHYEFNADDDDDDGVVDEGTSGVDTNGDGFPDDTTDQETSPPYPVPLRGLEVRIRCYEPTSKQVRQTTIRHSFSR